MRVTQEQAVSIFQGLGFDGASTWTFSRLEKRLQSLDSTVDSDTTIGDADLDNLLDEVLGALREGEHVALLPANSKAKKSAPKVKTDEDEAATESDVAESEEEVSNEEADDAVPVKAKKEKKEKDSTGGKQRQAPRDQFGTRLGSGAAAINAVVTKKPQSFEEIAQASGQPVRRVKDHVRWMQLHEFAVKTDAGIALTGKTA